MLMTIKTETDNPMEQLVKDIFHLVENVGQRAFCYLEEESNMIKLKGSFSDSDAVNFIAALIQERPQIKEHVTRLVNDE